MIEWNIDFDSLPGPDRSELPFVHDVVRPAESKVLAAVVYSVVEWRMGWEGGYFALFQGPPEAPTTIWCPDGLQCMGYQNVLQWLEDDRYVVVSGYMYDEKKRVEQPFIFVDVAEQQVAFYPFMNSCNAVLESDGSDWRIRQRDRDARFQSRNGERIDPRALDWRPWAETDELKAAYWQGELGTAM